MCCLPIIVLGIDGAPAALRGALSRRLLEIRPNCFVGALPRRAVEQLWAVVLDADPKDALLVVPARNELGMRLLTIGQHPSAPVEHFGIQLVAVRKGGTLPPAPEGIEGIAISRKRAPRASGG